MGELIEVSGAVHSPMLLGVLLSVLGLACFALIQWEAGNNDDDDSFPGGGLMQPVS